MVDHELALLGHALRNNALLDVLGRVQSDDFADPALGVIWETAQNLRNEQTPVNRLTLSALATPDALSGATLLQRIEAVDLRDDPGDLANVIVEASKRRRLAATAQWAASAAAEPSITFPALVAKLSEEVDALAARTNGDTRVGWDVAAQVDDLLGNLDADFPCVPYGIADLDKFAHGLEPATLTIVGGRPGMGKSAFLGSICRRAAQAGHGVMAFSLEMTRTQWLTRMACELTRSSSFPVKVEDGVRRNFPSPAHRHAFEAAMKRIAGMPLKLDDTRGITLAEMRRRIRRAKVEFEAIGKKLDLVLVDQLGKVRPSDRYKGTRYLEVGELTTGLREAALHENVALLVAHQINRGVEGRDDKRPRLSDLRESGDIEQDADVVLLLYREAYYHAERAKDAEDDAQRQIANADAQRTQDELEVVVAKQRHGPTGSVTLWCDIACNALESMARAPHPRKDAAA